MVYDMRPLSDSGCVQILKNIKATRSINKNYRSHIGILKMLTNKMDIKLDKSAQYLDIGCNDGIITKAFGKLFDLSNIYGLDICIPKTKLYIDNIKVYDGINIPFNENTFDFITILQTFHHIEDNNLNKLIQDVSRVISTNGYLLIKEHDVKSNEVRKLVELEHILFNVKDNIEEKDGYNILNLKSVEEIDKLMTTYNFVKRSYTNITNEPTCIYYALYQKYNN